MHARPNRRRQNIGILCKVFRWPCLNFIIHFIHLCWNEIECSYALMLLFKSSILFLADRLGHTPADALLDTGLNPVYFTARFETYLMHRTHHSFLSRTAVARLTHFTTFTT